MVFGSVVAIIRRSRAALSVEGDQGIQRWLGLGLLATFVGFQIQGLTQWNFGDLEVLHNVLFLWALAGVMNLTPASSSNSSSIRS